MSEKHEVEFDGFDLRVSVSAEGRVEISFHESGKCVFSTDWDTFRDVIDVVARFGLGMRSPMIVEAEDTREAIESACA